MSHEFAANNDSAHPGEHAVPFSILFGTLMGLLILTFLTVAAYWIDLGALNLWIAMGIATIKAALVCLYFMHLRWDRPFVSIFFLGSLLFVFLFISFILLDAKRYYPNVYPVDSPQYAPKVLEQQMRG